MSAHIALVVLTSLTREKHDGRFAWTHAICTFLLSVRDYRLIKVQTLDMPLKMIG